MLGEASASDRAGEGAAARRARPARRGLPSRRGRRLLVRLRRGLRRAAARLSSSLTRRILVLNLGGLGALLLGALYLNETRGSVVDARAQGLLVQGEIIAAATAGAATVETDGLAVDPDTLLQLQAGETTAEEAGVEFSINPERVAPVLRRLVAPTRTRARVYDRDGTLIVDTRGVFARGGVLTGDLPPPGGAAWWEELAARAARLLTAAPRLPPEEEGAAPPREALRALAGATVTAARVTSAGETVVLVALPVQRFRGVRGALLLSTPPGEIDAVLAAARWRLVALFGAVTAVMALLSLLLAGTIARPVRRLADAADKVRRGLSGRHAIPDLSGRTDEIGHLSVALREMTRALTDRAEHSERFAADVSHELKNPLTSLRSAVETLPLARGEESRARLMAVIQHDVRRLDRLITDIAEASRLDADLARGAAEPVDLAALLEAVRDAGGRGRCADARVALAVEPPPPGAPVGRDAFLVLGQASRLAQVVHNLVDNALSFSPPGGEVRVALRRRRGEVEVSVEDDGPGVPEEALERVFERFYTDRPGQGFGQNSGLGLAIARQIAAAHRGRLTAGNRRDAAGEVLGARFALRLPAALT